MGVSKNSGTPKSSISIGFSIIKPSILAHLVDGNRLGMSSQPRFANNKFDGAAVWRLTRVTCGKLDVNVDILNKIGGI